MIERLDGTYEEGDSKTGQFPRYGKVGGVIVPGNEDGAHEAAGPGPSCIDAGGDWHMYTNKTARYLAHNTVYMARLLKDHSIPTNLKALTAEAEKVGQNHCLPRHGD